MRAHLCAASPAGLPVRARPSDMPAEVRPPGTFHSVRRKDGYQGHASVLLLLLDGLRARVLQVRGQVLQVRWWRRPVQRLQRSNNTRHACTATTNDVPMSAAACAVLMAAVKRLQCETFKPVAPVICFDRQKHLTRAFCVAAQE